MTLYEQWEKTINEQTDDSFPEFWEKYSSTEKRIYSAILDNPTDNIQGTFSELAARYEADPVIFMGFLDGINSSLNVAQDFQGFDENARILLDIDYEKLYYNMLVAEADYLYTLPQWEVILTDDTRESIITAYKRSRTVIKDKQPGRNDPCPCGSGKKYKKCCGANL